MATPTIQKQTALQVLEAEFADRKADFQAVLPSNCTFERFIRVIKTAAIQTPELLTVDKPTLFMSCFKAAQDGLLPDGREAALVIYNTKQKDGSFKKLVQYMPMLGGILKKIRNSGDLLTIRPHVIYENDKFNYCLGDNEHIIHEPCMQDRGKPIGAYAIAIFKDGAIYREVMNVAEIEKVRNISRAKNSSPWQEHWGEMAKKTVIRRLAKRLPMSTDLEEVIRRDDEMFDFNNAPQKQHNPTLEALNRQVIEAEITPVEEINVSPELEAQAEAYFAAQENKPSA